MRLFKIIVAFGLPSAASQLLLHPRRKGDPAEAAATTNSSTPRTRDLQSNFQSNCQEAVSEARRGLPAGTTCTCAVEAGFQGYRCSSPQACLSGVEYEDLYGESCPGTICEKYTNKVELQNDGTVVSTEDKLTYTGDTEYKEIASVNSGSKIVTRVKVKGLTYECNRFESCEDGPFSFDCTNIQRGATLPCPGGGFFFEKFSLCPAGGAMTPTTKPIGTGGFVGLCFPGTSKVKLQNNNKSIMMKDLALGDKIMVADGRYEAVYSFGHKQENVLAPYLRIGTSEGLFIELSENHMVFVAEGNPVPASLLKIGDILLTGSGETAVVTTIRNVERKGAYAPFTESGSVVVDGIVASNYIALGNSSRLQISGREFPVSHQWLAHLFTAPHRLASRAGLAGERYSEAGISAWVDLPHRTFRSLLSRSPFLVIPLLAPPFLLLAAAEAISSANVAWTATALAVLLGTALIRFNENRKSKTPP